MADIDHLRKLQERDARLRFRYDAHLGVVTYLRGNLGDVKNWEGAAVPAAARKFLQTHAPLFGKIDPTSLRILQDTRDVRDGRTVSFQQYLGSIRVQGGTIRFHVAKPGILDTVSSHLFPDLAGVPRRPRVSKERAVRIAQQAAKTSADPVQAPELLVYRHEKKPRLVWEVRLVGERLRAAGRRPRVTWLAGAHGAPPHWVCLVDAVNGQVLVRYDNLQTAGPVVAVGTGYYSAGGTVNAWFNDLTNQLRDTTRTGGGGPEVVTDDEDGAAPSEDADANWNDLTTAPRDQNQGAEVDAHRYAGAVADYYQTAHGRNSIDGSGGAVSTLVHYLTDYDNAFWDDIELRLKVCDGSGAAPGFDYLCAGDVMAHEFTHGVTQFTCNLQYLNESGALNEAFSDIFAAFITGDWLLGEDCWLGAMAPALRNMMDPTNGGLWDPADPITSVLAGHQPSHYSVRYTGAFDNGGVHINSGIINNLFYLLTVGGTHTVSGVAVTGIGQSAAEQMLYRSMTVNLVGNPTADFLDFREAMLDACLDLFPTDLGKLTQVKNAFNAVGIGPDLYVRDNLADTGEEPYPGTYLYASPDVINRTAPAATPAADFADLTDDALWENVEFGQPNYIYVRLQNRGSADGNATINVYFSAATTFGTPASWTHIGTLTETAIAPGSLRVSGPLTFPAALIPAAGLHYCMIAVVTDGLDPAPDHTLIGSVADFLNYVRNTNNIAYRNMDVVDMVPAAPFAVQALVQTLPNAREPFDLRVDLRQFPPGARILVRAPARALDGAIARGLKLVARGADQDTYLLVGPQGRAGVRAGGLRPAEAPEYGFDNVLVENPFQLVVDTMLPDTGMLQKLGVQGAQAKYSLAIRQLWKGAAVGAVGLIARPRGKKPRRGVRTRAPRKRRRA